MRLTIGAAALIASLMALVAWPSGAFAAERPAYRTYVACAKVVEAKPSRKCAQSAEKGAFFRSNRRDVRYKVCVVFPTRKALCASRQQARQGELYVNEITSKMLGVHRVTWFVKGRRVGVFRFRIVADPNGKKQRKSAR